MSELRAMLDITSRNIGTDAVQTVNARDLHTFLEVGKDFSTWIKGRIEQYGFTDGLDYVSFDAATPQNGGAEAFPQNGGKPQGGRPAKEYAISIDMAKELAMVERNDKGKQARQYFIECERRAKAAPAALIPQSLPEALRLAADLAEQKAQAEAALAIAAPKADALDRIARGTEGAVCIRIAAKLAQVPEKQFFAFLNQEGWIYRHHHSKTWMGYSDKESAGLLELKKTPVQRDDGSEKIVEQVMITPKGQAKAAELIARKAPWLHKTRRQEQEAA